MKIYTDKRLLRAGLIGGTLSRQSGNMRESACQQTAFNELGIDPAHILHLHQTHSDIFIPLHTSQEALQRAAGPLLDADAWIFSPTLAGWGAAIITADCVPLFLWDDTGTCASLAHCGWRGVVKRLAQKVAQELLAKHPHLSFNAWLGPHIQSCCFEVQEDVANQFPAACIIHRNNKIFVDLNVEIKRQLILAGIKENNIHAPHYCTCGDKENFFSWRRDQQKDALLSFVYKP